MNITLRIKDHALQGYEVEYDVFFIHSILGGCDAPDMILSRVPNGFLTGSVR